MTLCQTLATRWDQMIRYQSLARSLWQDLGDYINVKRSFVITRRPEGASQTRCLYDSTAPKANDDLAAFIAGTLTNMSLQWFGLRVEDDRWNQDNELRQWLDSAAETIYKFQRASNFSTEIQEAYKDLGAFGTACLLQEELRENDLFTGLLFRAEAVGSYALSENAEGFVDTVFRQLILPGNAALDKWGDALHEKTRERIDKYPDEKVKVIHAVFPAHHAKEGLARLRFPIASVYFEEELKHKLAISGYEEFPFHVPRWSKTSGEMYGRGPGHTALPDILTLNKAIELTLQAWARAANPPMLAQDDAVIGQINTAPDGITWTRNPEAIRLLESASRFDVNAQLVSDVRTAIKDIFFANQFTLPDKSIITATEVERRLELMQQVLGPVVGRLEHELLSPCINRSFQVLLRNGKIPPPPRRFQEWAATQPGGAGLGISYEGPLARAQRNSDIKATSDAVTFVTALAEIFPEGKDNVDWDTVIQDRLLKSGIPAKYIKEPRLRDKERAARAEAQAALQAQEAATQGGATLKNVAQAAKAAGETNTDNLDGGPDDLSQAVGEGL